MHCVILPSEDERDMLRRYMMAFDYAEKDPVFKGLLYNLCRIEEFVEHLTSTLINEFSELCSIDDSVAARLRAIDATTRRAYELANLVKSAGGMTIHDMLLNIWAMGTRTSAAIGLSIEDADSSWSVGVKGDVYALCKPQLVQLTATIVVKKHSYDSVSYTVRIGVNARRVAGSMQIKPHVKLSVTGGTAGSTYEEEDEDEDTEFVEAIASCNMLRIFKPYAVIR